MDQRSTTVALKTLLGRVSSFFHKRCLVGFPWFWPSRPLGNQAMVQASPWQQVRLQYGRDHPPSRRALARVLVTMAWPFAALIVLGNPPIFTHPRPQADKEASWSILVGPSASCVVPGEYFAYELWHPDRKANIDNYLYSKEGVRLFGLLNQRLQPNPIDDKLAFYEI